MTSEAVLTHILREQVSGYKALLELLQQERGCLVDFNAECVEELSKKKDVLILKLRLLDDERMRLMKDFGSSTITLQTVAELTGNAAFAELRSQLKSLLQSIEEMNNFNRLLIERSLNYCRSGSSFFSFFGMGDSRLQRGTLISRET